MVAIFKTDVKNKGLAEKVLKALNSNWPGCRYNFDLVDSDCILRAQCESYQFQLEGIIQIVTSQSVQISFLDQISL